MERTLNKKRSLFKLGTAPKRFLFYVIGIIMLFILVGLSTSIAPAYRLSSDMISRLTTNVDSEAFLYLFTLETKSFEKAYPEDFERPKLTETLIQLGTNIKPREIKSLLGQELPGFPGYGNKIIVRGEGTDFTSLASESSPPLEDVLEDRPAEDIKEDEKDDSKEEKQERTTGDKEVVFIYSTHNRESFLPHLPESTSPNEAYHKEVNITKVSSRFEKGLNKQGIGTSIDKTDFMEVLNKNNWNYSKSYDASRNVAEEAVASNEHLEYIFDIHRDSLPRDKTTKNIENKDYAKILFVVGADHPNYEKNLKLATDLHYKIEEKYPGLSRGVIQKAGAGTNGVFNQDILDNAVLVEMGGYESKLEEMYLSADVLAEVFSEYYWDAEKVSNGKKENSNDS